jgi:Glyoxalase superfamily protein
MAEVMVPIFRVADSDGAAAWYKRLGFTVDDVHRFAPDLPQYMHLRRGDVGARVATGIRPLRAPVDASGRCSS